MCIRDRYQVDVTGGWGYLRIVDAIYLPAQVGDADDDITLLFLLQCVAQRQADSCTGRRFTLLMMSSLSPLHWLVPMLCLLYTSTLDKLALLAGFQSWDDFQGALHGTEDGLVNYDAGEK